MATFRVMAWRGIPTQVQASDGPGAPVNVQLPLFFQQEIDRVAMREGLIDSDEYLEGWAWSEPQERDGSATEVAEAVAAQLAEGWKESPDRGKPRWRTSSVPLMTMACSSTLTSEISRYKVDPSSSGTLGGSKVMACSPAPPSMR